MQAIDRNNLPTPQIEEWKYTNLARAMPAGLILADKAQEIVIHKKRGQICEQAEDILFTGYESQHQQPRLKITLEAGAQLTVIERHAGSGAYWKNMVSTIELGDGAQLQHVRLQQDDERAVQTSLVEITMGKDAVYNGFSLNMGGKLSRHQVQAALKGAGGQCSFNGVNLLCGEQHGDTTIVIEHQAPHCASNQFYRWILDDEARGVFQGKVHVHQAAQKTNGYQLSNALLLSDKAEMDTKPELEIYADDVKCTHGATTGQLDEEPLFYLRSRGLSEAEARRLLIGAFVDEAVDKIEDEAFKTRISEVTGTWLQNALSK